MAWDRWYTGPHAGWWPYGLPELPGARDAIHSARRVANPGCYATAIALALAPLLAASVVEASDIVVVAASGTSGAGRAANERLLAAEVMGDLTPYKVGGSHQHLGELRQSLSAVAGDDVSMSFTPILAPMPRGILATCTALVRPGRDGRCAAGGLPAVRRGAVRDAAVWGQWPHTAATSGSNSAQLQVTLDEDAGRAVVVAAIDNLGKGAAGQAVQNANLMLGLPETTGLAVNGDRAMTMRAQLDDRAAPAGFRAAGVEAGLKSAGRDVALVVNDGPTYAAAGVFTTNRIKAAPVLWSEQVLRSGGALRAVVLNSGGANACTGPAGVPGHACHRRAGRWAAGLWRG